MMLSWRGILGTPQLREEGRQEGGDSAMWGALRLWLRPPLNSSRVLGQAGFLQSL